MATAKPNVAMKLIGAPISFIASFGGLMKVGADKQLSMAPESLNSPA